MIPENDGRPDRVRKNICSRTALFNAAPLILSIAVLTAGCSTKHAREAGRIEDLQGLQMKLAQSARLDGPQPMSYTIYGFAGSRGFDYRVRSIDSRKPGPGHIFLMVEMNLTGLASNTLTIMNSDISLNDAFGNKWSGHFWAAGDPKSDLSSVIPLKAWAGNWIEASTSDWLIASRSEEGFIHKFGAKGAITALSMIFEIPESRGNGLRLMFLDRVVADLPGK